MRAGLYGGVLLVASGEGRDRVAVAGAEDPLCGEQSLHAYRPPRVDSPVLMPTSAPSPKRNPSAKRVEALWNTHAESTRARKQSAAAWLSVTMHSAH